MPEPLIKKFTISKLFKERDVSITFDSDTKILVAENGYGKTTILNALYYVSTGDLLNLRKIDFELIEITFGDGERFELRHDELKIFGKKRDQGGFYDHLKRLLSEKTTDDLISDYFQLSEKQFKSAKNFKSAARESGFGESTLYNYIEKYIGSEESAAQQFRNNKALNRIKSKMPKNILYLPTYRRVEIDLGIKNEEDDERNENINFGMKDVQNLINLRTQEILTSSVEWFSKVNGQMLSQLADGFSLDEEVRQRIKDPDAVKIVLDRIGTNIDEETKSKIPLLIESGEIFDGHDPLIYFISNLVKVYAQQQDNDYALQRFTDVCNRYLADKKIQYDEGKVLVKVVRRKNNSEVDIEALSSGEKQIISLFAKLYLQKHDEYAIFFDEPELSLSMEWQKTLLPDIIDSGKCKFLFTTTHSPFIFANDFKKHTVDLSVYIKEL